MRYLVADHEQCGLQRIQHMARRPGRLAQYIKTVCFQYEGQNAIATIHTSYPSLTLYETELECGSGTNDWSYAEGTCFQQMLWYFDNYANGFMQWNMVLDQSNSSSWGWVQCRHDHGGHCAEDAAFHPQHYCAKHFSYYVQPGAKRIKTSGTFTNQVGSRKPRRIGGRCREQ